MRHPRRRSTRQPKRSATRRAGKSLPRLRRGRTKPRFNCNSRTTASATCSASTNCSPERPSSRNPESSTANRSASSPRSRSPSTEAIELIESSLQLNGYVLTAVARRREHPHVAARPRPGEPHARPQRPPARPRTLPKGHTHGVVFSPARTPRSFGGRHARSGVISD